MARTCRTNNSLDASTSRTRTGEGRWGMIKGVLCTLLVFVLCATVEVFFDGYGLLLALILTWPNTLLFLYFLDGE